MQDVRPVRGSRVIRWMAGVAASALLVGAGVAIGAHLTAGSRTARASTTQANVRLVGNAAISNGLTSASLKRDLARLRRLLRIRGEYGRITFKTKKGSVTVAFERGVIRSAASGSVIVKAADGTIQTWNLVSKTVVVRARNRASTSVLAPGQRVFVVGAVVGGADDARLVVIRG